MLNFAQAESLDLQGVPLFLFPLFGASYCLPECLPESSPEKTGGKLRIMEVDSKRATEKSLT